MNRLTVTRDQHRVTVTGPTTPDLRLATRVAAAVLDVDPHPFTHEVERLVDGPNSVFRLPDGYLFAIVSVTP